MKEDDVIQTVPYTLYEMLQQVKEFLTTLGGPEGPSSMYYEPGLGLELKRIKETLGQIEMYRGFPVAVDLSAPSIFDFLESTEMDSAMNYAVTIMAANYGDNEGYVSLDDNELYDEISGKINMSGLQAWGPFQLWWKSPEQKGAWTIGTPEDRG